MRFVVVAVIAFMAWPAHAHYIDASAVFADRCAERASKLDGLEAQQSFQEAVAVGGQEAARPARRSIHAKSLLADATRGVPYFYRKKLAP